MDFLLNFIRSFTFYYLFILLFVFSLYLVILVFYNFSRLGTTFHFYLWKASILYPLVFIPGLLSPFFLIRPFHVVNARLCAWFIRKISYLTGVTWELRGANIAGIDQGTVICCNHQSDMDIFGQFNLWSVFNKMTAIAKKELFYVLPFGPGAWLCGLRYIDRSSSKKSYETLLSVTRLMTDEKTKIWIYPEGTRNCKGGFLPFKKGAFVMSIEAQVPIMPVVIAPYYYMDEMQKKVFYEKKHNIVSILDPIPTKGLTKTDVEHLKEKTQAMMLREYEKLKEEVTVRSRDPNWINKIRPRLTLTNRKFKKT